jgi:hypothetical protein
MRSGDVPIAQIQYRMLSQIAYLENRCHLKDRRAKMESITSARRGVDGALAARTKAMRLLLERIRHRILFELTSSLPQLAGKRALSFRAGAASEAGGAATRFE